MREIRFADFVTLQRGFDLPRSKRGNGLIPVVGAAQLQGTHSEAKVEPPVVTTGRSGTLGKVLIQKVPSWPLNTCLWVKDFKGNDPVYVYYYLQTLGLKQYNAGAGVPTLNRNHLDHLPLIVHEVHIQNRIAAILSAYDDLIENNTRRIEILEEMARRLYEEWLMPQSEDGGWGAATFAETLADHIGGGWGKEVLDNKHQDLAFVIRGTDIPGARVLDIMNCPLRHHAASNLRSRKLADGDLVMEVSGGSKDQLVGRPLIVSKRLLDRFDNPVICASFCKRMQVNRKLISPLLLYHYLSKAYIDGTMAQFQVQSTGITNFQFKPFLEKAEVPVPPKDLQARFDLIAGPMRQQIELLGASNANLRAQRDLLLPKLVSGEIDVSEAEKAMEAAE